MVKGVFKLQTSLLSAQMTSSCHPLETFNNVMEEAKIALELNVAAIYRLSACITVAYNFGSVVKTRSSQHPRRISCKRQQQKL